MTLPKTSTRHEKAIARIMRNEAAKPPAKQVKRAARRIRQLSAWIVQPGLDDCECQVMDVSADGAKIISAIPSQVPDRFALAFAKGDDKHRLRSRLAAREGARRPVREEPGGLS